MNKTEEFDKASRWDKTKYSEVWIKQIRVAVELLSNRDHSGFFDATDVLIMSLLSPERLKVREYQRTLEGTKLEQYNQIFEYIIDVLDAKGFLVVRENLPHGGGDING